MSIDTDNKVFWIEEFETYGFGFGYVLINLNTDRYIVYSSNLSVRAAVNCFYMACDYWGFPKLVKTNASMDFTDGQFNYYLTKHGAYHTIVEIGSDEAGYISAKSERVLSHLINETLVDLGDHPISFGTIVEASSLKRLGA